MADVQMHRVRVEARETAFNLCVDAEGEEFAPDPIFLMEEAEEAGQDAGFFMREEG